VVISEVSEAVNRRGEKMGCDIHTAVEVKNGDGWHWDRSEKFPDVYREGKFTDEPFDWRSYGMFGFLANVRNYSQVPTIVEDRGLPDDLSPELADQDDDDARWLGNHSFSYLTLRELLDYDYDQVFWDRRITRQEAPNYWNGAALANEGEGQHLTIREFLGDGFFGQIEILKTYGEPDDVRVVFGFDN
jgi:hypothetical protein